MAEGGRREDGAGGEEGVDVLGEIEESDPITITITITEASYLAGGLSDEEILLPDPADLAVNDSSVAGLLGVCVHGDSGHGWVLRGWFWDDYLKENGNDDRFVIRLSPPRDTCQTRGRL